MINARSADTVCPARLEIVTGFLVFSFLLVALSGKTPSFLGDAWDGLVARDLTLHRHYTWLIIMAIVIIIQYPVSLTSALNQIAITGSIRQKCGVPEFFD